MNTRKRNNLNKEYARSGMILIVVLWVLVILSLLAVGLGRRTGIELKMSKYAVGKMRAKYIAHAGVVYALEQIKRDNVDEEAMRFDTLFQCGFFLEEGERPEDLFKRVEMEEGYFSVYAHETKDPENTEERYGLRDEERKININALDKNNYSILKYLMMELGYEEQESEDIALAVMDWKDTDDDDSDGKGAETEYYESLEIPYVCKNAAFDSLVEILHVKNMTKEIFDDIKNYLTIFPKKGKFLVNLNTAPKNVLMAFAKNYTGSETQAQEYDAESLVEKVLDYRSGPDGQEGTDDDALVDVNKMNLNAKEKVLFLMMMNNRTEVSRFLRIVVKGYDVKTSISSQIDAIIDRDDLTVVYWNWT